MTLSAIEFYFIAPKEATNLVTNPSMEVATTGYAGIAGAEGVALTGTYQRRGCKSLDITPVTSVASGVYYAVTLSVGVQYSFSADILDVAGQTFNLCIYDNSGNLKSSLVTWVGNGYWKRRSVTWTSDANGTFQLRVYRNAVASTTHFYTDGWQLEVGAVSTYLDGDMTGFVTGETAYYWEGTPHASKSWRSGQTRSGGTLVKLSTYATLLAISGLGMASLTNIAVRSNYGGSAYQNTIANERKFSLVVNFAGGGDYAVTQRNKEAITSAIKPDKTVYRQPLMIQCDLLDANGMEIAETLEIPCLYEGGLEMSGDGDNFNEKAALSFRMFVPLIRQQGEHGTALGYQTSVPNTGAIIQRGSNGAWSAVGTGANSAIIAMVLANDGALYAGGSFTDLGDANGDRIAKWNGTAWSALGTGGNDEVRALVLGADGALYAGGLFTLMGGVANTVRIAKWNGAAWSALGTGANDVVYALAVGPDGSLYAGGLFTQMGGVANTAYIAKWNGATWSALGTGANGRVSSLVVGKDGMLYAGGYFTSMGGVANTAYIAKWNGSTWSALGTGANTNVYALAMSHGLLYAGGEFSTIGGVSAAAIAMWDGSVWHPLGSGMSGIVPNVFAILALEDGRVYVGGNFSSAGGVALPGRLAVWNGSTWGPEDIILPNPTLAIYAAAYSSKSKTLYLGYDVNGTTSTSANVTVSNVGSATAYPKIVLTGPGAVSQIKNYTTGKSIFLGLTLLAGEVATLDLNPTNVSFVSNFRGNLMNVILPGSDLSFELLPGANSVSSFIYSGATGNSSIVITWKDGYWSIDGAVR